VPSEPDHHHEDMTRLLLAPLLALALSLPLTAGALPAAAASAPVRVLDPARAELARHPDNSADFPRIPNRCFNARREPNGHCRLTTFAGRPFVVLWGDSHAWMYLPAIRKLAKRNRVNLVMRVIGSCPVSLPLPKKPRSRCETNNLDTVTYLKKLKNRGVRFRVIIGGFWAGYTKAIRMVRKNTAGAAGLAEYSRRMATLGVERSPGMFRRLGRLKIPVDIIAPAATVPAKPGRCQRGRDPYQCNLPRERAMYSEKYVKRWMQNKLIKHLSGKTRVIDPSGFYCGPKKCRAHVNGINTFYDDIHLGAELTAQMRRYFAPVFKQLVS